MRTCVAITLAALTIATPFELVAHPERRAITLTAYAIEVACGLLTLLAARVPRLRDRPRLVAVSFMLVLAWTVAWHIVSEGRPLFLLGSSYVTMLTTLSVLMPWGWRPQLTVTLVCIVTVTLAIVGSDVPLAAEDILHIGLVLGAVGAACVFIAGFLDQTRASDLRHAAALEASVERERAHAAVLTVIHQAQARVLVADEPSAVFRALLDDVRALTRSTWGLLAEVRRRPDESPRFVLHALAAPRHATTSPGEADVPAASLIATAANDPTPTVLTGAGLTARPLGLAGVPGPRTAVLCLPIRHGNDVVGLIALGDRPDGYDPAIVESLTPVATTFGSLITATRSAAHRAAAEAAERREADLTAMLADAGQDFLGLRDAPSILTHMTERTLAITGADQAVTVQWSPGTPLATPLLAHGLSDDDAARALRMRIPRVLLGTLLARAGTPTVAVVDDVATDTLAAFGFPATRATRLLCLPISLDDEIVAAQFHVWHSPRPPLGASHRRVLDGLTKLATMALTTARLLQDLQRANQLKSEFVSTMSHELRTPLNIILGYTEMARDEADGRARTDLLDHIEGAARDQLSLIDSTLEIGRLEAGVNDVRREPLSLPAFWQALGTACERIPRAAGVTLDWGAVPDRTVHTDPRKLTIMIRNLVGNALKFTEHGSVATSVEILGDTLVCRVRDTGIGIRTEDQHAIFEMFRQADGSETRKFGGTGLGLYIVKRFTDQLGGTIVVESVPGAGAAFTITLPNTVALDGDTRAAAG